MQCADAGPQASKSLRRRDPQKYTCSYQKALFKSYSIVSKAELLRNTMGELVKIKNDLVTDNLESYLFQRWEPSDLIVIHLLFLCFCVSIFLYYGISVFLFQ